jgi:hypothetical protein
MLRPLLAAVLLCLAACSPTFNWREVRAEAAPLKVMLPCKPDKGSRRVPMAGRQVELQVMGCEAGGATFAVLFGDIVEPGRDDEVLAQWKAATLGHMQGVSLQERPFLPPGALALPNSVRVVASGKRADGSPVQGQAAYFARGSQVFQAVIYSDRVTPEAADTFFAGLKFE